MEAGQIKAIRLIIAYPFGIFLVATLLNILAFNVHHYSVNLPLTEHVYALSITAILLCINHSWIMTATELTRAKYKMYATPEEWQASGTSWDDINDFAIKELERTHNTHRNTNENTLYFLALTIPFILSSPPTDTTYTWLVGFAIARLGYTYSYLTGKDNLRGVFMSLSLIAMYGLASYLLLSLFN